MENEWEEVIPRGRRTTRGGRVGEEVISVIKSGGNRLSISLRGRFKDFFTGYDYVRVLIDAQRRRMLLKPSAYEKGRVFKITRTKSGTYVHCVSALRRLGVSPGRYQAQWDEELGGLVINFGATEERAERWPEDIAWRLLHEPDDWGPGTEDTSKRIDELLYASSG